jgi:hypothetical protein
MASRSKEDRYSEAETVQRRETALKPQKPPGKRKKIKKAKITGA